MTYTFFGVFFHKKCNNFIFYKEQGKKFGPPAASQGPFPNQWRSARGLAARSEKSSEMSRGL